MSKSTKERMGKWDTETSRTPRNEKSPRSRRRLHKNPEQEIVVSFHLLFFQMPHLLTLSSIRKQRLVALPSPRQALKKNFVINLPKQKM